MPGPVRTRLACDRCHSQKLRCPKDPASSACTRCARAGATCTFSPPGRTSQQSGPPVVAPVDETSASSVADVLPEAVDAVGLDWPFMYDGLSLESLLGVVTPNPSEPVRSEAADEGPGRSGDRPNNGSDVRADVGEKPRPYFHELTKLAAEVGELLTAMPADAVLHLPRDELVQSIVHEMSKLFDHSGLLERTFANLQRLVDLYPDIVKESLSLGLEPRRPCEAPDCIHHGPLPAGLAPIAERMNAEGSGPQVDLALANLLLVSHMRVLDVLDAALAHSISCFRLTYASPTLTELDFHTPDMRIGSFVPPKASSAMMQAVLLKHLLSGLGRRLRQFRDALSSIPGGQSDKRIQCLVIQVELLQERHDDKTRECEGLAPAMFQMEQMKQELCHDGARD